MNRRRRVVVVGAGVGGLVAAAELAHAGADVTVIERATAPGGKMRELEVGGQRIDAGPTVFTMRWIFDALFEACGTRLAAHLDLVPASIIARHAWLDGARLDLHADVARSAAAIGDFAGAADARGFRDFCTRAAEVYATLRDTFISAQRPSPLELAGRVGLHRLDALWRMAPHLTYWRVLGDYFRDPRLRQLFGRYATYVGSSPLAAPATLMLIAHVEQDGVWTVRGGMRRVADALEALGSTAGAQFRYGTTAAEIVVQRGRATGIRLADGEMLAADAVVYNGDVAALGTGRLGADVARVFAAMPPTMRSLSAITWCAYARTRGFPLEHHNVFFAGSSPLEFDALFRERTIARAPTIYVCAQDRGTVGAGVSAGAPERLLVLVNAPADGDVAPLDPGTLAALEHRTFTQLRDSGLEVEWQPGNCAVTTPSGFDALFPSTGGALYGRANHGALGSFARPSAASRVPALYLAGGSAHPGPGVPMVAVSGRLAAQRVLADFART